MRTFARSAVVFTTAALVSCLALATPPPPFQVSVHVQPGEIAPATSRAPHGSLLEAVATARHEIAEHPNSAAGYLSLGTALREGGNFQAANEALSRALQLNPKLSSAWLQKGLIALKDARNGTIARTEAFFEKAAEADPANAEARLQLASIFLRQGDFKKAEAELAEVLHTHPQSAGAYDGLGFIDLQRGNARAAASNFRQAIRLRSPYPEAEENLGEALLQSGDAAGSRDAFQKALAGGLTDASMATYGLASALKRLGETAQADSEFAKARELMGERIALDRAQDQDNRGLQLWHAGDLNGAAAAFRDAIRADASYAEVHNNLGGVLWERKDAAGAEREFAAAVHDQPDFAKARNNLGNVLLSKGKVDQAIAQFQSAVAEQPGFASAHVNLAIALLKGGQKRQAQAELRQALALDPTIGAAHIELGLLLVPGSGQLTPDARHEIEQGLHLEPQLWSALPAAVYEQLVLGN